MSHAAAEAPPAESGTGQAPPPEPRPAPATIEPKPGYAAESYAWPDESASSGDGGTTTPPAAGEGTGGAPAQPATPPSQPAQPAPPSPPPAAAAADPLAEARAAFVKGEATREQKALLTQHDEDLRAIVDDRAQKRAGNLLQQQQEREAQQRQKDEKWAAVEAYHESYLAAKHGSDPAAKAKAEAWENSEAGAEWLASYRAEAGERAKTAASQARNSGALTQTQVEEAIREAGQGWNRVAAEAFATEVRSSKLFPNLSAATQKALTELTQETNETWVREWVSRLDRDVEAHIRKVREEALEAGRNEGNAAATPPNPVQIAGAPGEARLSAQQVLTHYMDWGLGPDPDGHSITEEQYAWAKKQKGILE